MEFLRAAGRGDAEKERGRPEFESFSSFVAAEGELAEEPTPGRQREKLAWENGVLRMKLTAISLQVNHFKEVFKKENVHLREQLQHLEQALVKSVEMVKMAARKQGTQVKKGPGGWQGVQPSPDRRREVAEMAGEYSPQSVVWGERPPLAVGRYQKKLGESGSKAGERGHLRYSNVNDRFGASMGYEMEPRDNFGTPIKRSSWQMERGGSGRTVGRESRVEQGGERQWVEMNSRVNGLHERRWDQWEKENKGGNGQRREGRGLYGYDRMDRYY